MNEFTNWSGQYRSRPSAETFPESPEELQEIIRDEARFPSPAVAIGSAHSNSGCNVLDGGTAVHMKQFRYIREPTADEVTAGAGVQLFELHRFLADRQLQLPFTPEIGNATLGSVACCCLKDAAIGQSSGIATTMVKAIRFVDADGNLGSARRGDPDWELMTSSHGLFVIVYEVVLDVLPMRVVIQNYVRCNVKGPDFESIFRKTLKENDGVFGLLDASTGDFILETRRFSTRTEAPNTLENLYNGLDQRVFKFFNPFIGAIDTNWYSRSMRRVAMAAFGFMKWSFPKGRRTFKNLKPIDYSHRYHWRWDFHFWAYPIADFPTRVLPDFLAWLKDYKSRNPDFDEKGLMACYRLRKEDKAILSPTYDGERMTVDPVRPVSEDKEVMAAWDRFCSEYSEFALQHGGTCTFNQTKVLTRTQVERAFGSRWARLKEARERADPRQRFLIGYFKSLMYGK